MRTCISICLLSFLLVSSWFFFREKKDHNAYQSLRELFAQYSHSEGEEQDLLIEKIYSKIEENRELKPLYESYWIQHQITRNTLSVNHQKEASHVIESQISDGKNPSLSQGLYPYLIYAKTTVALSSLEEDQKKYEEGLQEAKNLHRILIPEKGKSVQDHPLLTVSNLLRICALQRKISPERSADSAAEFFTQIQKLQLDRQTVITGAPSPYNTLSDLYKIDQYTLEDFLREKMIGVA